MANLIRSAKSGSDWTRRELAAYNITVVSQTKPEFFGVNDLPVPAQPTIIGFMAAEDRADAQEDDTKKLLFYLYLVLNPKAGQEAAVDNFMAKLLEKLGYDAGNRIIFIQRAFPFPYLRSDLFPHKPISVS